ncbi:MAG: hypothetical protein R3D53_11965 [Paracoccaceae bacterium]
MADRSGGHAFAETLDEHNRNVARWREIEARSNPRAHQRGTETGSPACARFFHGTTTQP